MMRIERTGRGIASQQLPTPDTCRPSTSRSSSRFKLGLVMEMLRMRAQQVPVPACMPFSQHSGIELQEVQTMQSACRFGVVDRDSSVSCEQRLDLLVLYYSSQDKTKQQASGLGGWVPVSPALAVYLTRMPQSAVRYLFAARPRVEEPRLYRHLRQRVLTTCAPPLLIASRDMWSSAGPQVLKLLRRNTSDCFLPSLRPWMCRVVLGSFLYTILPPLSPSSQLLNLPNLSNHRPRSRLARSIARLPASPQFF